MLLLLTLMIVCPAAFVNVLWRTSHAALLASLLPNPATLVRALSALPPVAASNWPLTVLAAETAQNGTQPEKYAYRSG